MQAIHIQLIPRISEKTFALREQNKYTFTVPKTVNKAEVAAAVASQYGVTVTGVKIVITKGKKVQTIRKGGRPVAGRRTDVKKAYVTLAEGDSIKIFDEITEEKK